jgi:hypothetical protein
MAYRSRLEEQQAIPRSPRYKAGTTAKTREPLSAREPGTANTCTPRVPQESCRTRLPQNATSVTALLCAVRQQCVNRHRGCGKTHSTTPCRACARRCYSSIRLFASRRRWSQHVKHRQRELSCSVCSSQSHLSMTLLAPSRGRGIIGLGRFRFRLTALWSYALPAIERLRMLRPLCWPANYRLVTRLTLTKSRQRSMTISCHMPTPTREASLAN